MALPADNPIAQARAALLALAPWQLLGLLCLWVVVVAVCFGVPVAAGVWLGDAADWHYRSSPVGVLAGAGLGVLLGTALCAGAGVLLWRQVVRGWAGGVAAAAGAEKADAATRTNEAAEHIPADTPQH